MFITILCQVGEPTIDVDIGIRFLTVLHLFAILMKAHGCAVHTGVFAMTMEVSLHLKGIITLPWSIEWLVE